MDIWAYIERGDTSTYTIENAECYRMYRAKSSGVDRFEWQHMHLSTAKRNSRFHHVLIFSSTPCIFNMDDVVLFYITCSISARVSIIIRWAVTRVQLVN